MLEKNCFFSAAVNLFSVLAKDFDKETCGGICLKILRKSGKIALLRCPHKGGKKPDFTKAFTIEVGHVKQIDEDGKPVGKPMNSLESQYFSFTPLNKNDNFDGIKAASVELEAYLKDTNGTLRLKAYTFCNAGNSSFGNDTFAVQNGSLKVLIEVRREGDPQYVSNNALQIDFSFPLQQSLQYNVCPGVGVGWGMYSTTFYTGRLRSSSKPLSFCLLFY